MTPPQYNPEDRPVATLLAPDILALLDDAPTAVAAETEEVHAADLADVAELLPRDKVPALLAALPPGRAADVLEYLDEELRVELLEAMSARQAAALVSEMTPDDRADTLEDIEEEHAEEILAAIPAAARRETEKLLAYDPDSAGGLMTTEFVSVPATMGVEAALAGVRNIARSGRREAMYQIYVTDESGRLVGVLSLRELLAAPDGAKVGDMAWSEVMSVKPQADREEVARVTSNYDLVAVPVIDDTSRVLGVVTVDDVIDAIQAEQTEDVQKLGGMEALDEPYMTIGFWRMVWKRGGWLSFLFISEMFTASAMGHYADDLQKVIALALFIPLVMSSGGNSGSQATSLIIRAMALGEIRLRDWWRVAMREIPTGIAMGLGLCVLGIGRILLWQKLGIYDYDPHHVLIALTVGFALIGIVTWGSLAGAMLPFVMKRLGFDPASASAPFVATLVDVTGLVIFFSMAQLVMRGTLL
ncbi:MAG TPA: magnesium transporter [Gemmatimonadaceae bacterium]|jgi:magnesium transporter|nr:magnesium transporter [Gemmatimonadaceae bacterium]